MAGASSDVRSSGKDAGFEFHLQRTLANSASALAARVTSGILQKISTRLSSIVVQDYAYNPV
jgi:hypothetical protein